MKKFATLCMSLLLLVCTACSGVASAQTAKPLSGQTEQLPLAENYVGADIGGGEVSYIVSRAIDVSINTFECCIRMDNNETTNKFESVIFGNYNYYNQRPESNRYSNFEVNTSGNLSVSWALERFTFTDFDVRTGEWLHLAVVRDVVANEMRLYANGTLKQTLKGVPSIDVKGNTFRHRIGGDERDGSRELTFHGEIGHVACYATARTAQEIEADYTDVREVKASTRGNDLLFSVMLSLGDNKAYDRSANFNDAVIMTNDYFYEGELFETGDYSFSVIGDTQRLARLSSQSYIDTIDWIADNAQERKIETTLFMGDLTDGNGTMTDEEWEREWTVVRDSITRLDGKVHYITTPGNHDYLDDVQARDLTMYNKYFPYEKYATQENFFGGAYRVGQTQNTYYLMTLSGVDYLFLALEFGADADVMEWVCNVLEQYPNRRAVIFTHGFLDQDGEMYADEDYLSAYWYFSRNSIPCTSSKYMWEDYLAKHENVFMILSGHSTMDTIAYKELVGEHGNTTMAFRIDPSYIIAGKGLDSIIALFTIDESESLLSINYFSATKNKLYNVQNQMRINFKNFTRLQPAYYGDGEVTV